MVSAAASDMTPRFLSVRCAREYNDSRLAPLLRVVLGIVYREAFSHVGWRPLVDSIWRSEAEEDDISRRTGTATSRIHTAWRAIDLSVSDAPAGAQQAVETAVNSLYEYDPARPAMLVAYGAPHGTGPHIHLQVHPSTRVRLSATRGMG